MRLLMTPVVLALLWVSGCSSSDASRTTGEATPAAATPASPASQPSRSPTREARPAPSPSPSAEDRRPEPSPSPLASDGRPRSAGLAIPAVDVGDLEVVPYRGTPDDAPGTAIQNRGLAASPHGPGGGVGPGGIGNYLVTAHRLSSTKAFLRLPELRRGDRVHVTAAGKRYTYEITRTRSTSFRSPSSLARQSAAVPGQPGRTPTRAMITLSTCATPEDHAQGNYWSDEFGNPEHRIDKIGVLVAIRPA